MFGGLIALSGFWLAGYQNLQKGLEGNKIVKIGEDYFYVN